MPETAITGGAIRRLPPLLVNQIAAGEVVERPASVVKELIDNALDAGATRITLDLEVGGVELVRVTDDGAGMAAADLPLAVAPHATSKIAAVEDLDRIATLGFRGEALASIASVSRLTIRSRPAAGGVAAGDGAAAELSVEGGEAAPIRPAAGAVGTSVSVRNLFYNTPARRKFLRTPATEGGHCLDAARQLAMSHPAVGFTVTADGRTVLDLPAGQSPRRRVLALLGPELEDQLLEVHADELDDSRGLALWGLVGLPAIARATAKSQHVFLNGRPIRDKTIQHALREAYRGLTEPGRYPTAAVMIEMEPGAVDVNVHPQKIEVRFRDPSLVHSVVLRAARDALRAADLTPAVRDAGWGMAHAAGDREVLPPRPVEAVSPGEVGRAAAAFVEFFSRPVPGQSGSRLSYEAARAAVGGEEGATPGGGDGAAVPSTSGPDRAPLSSATTAETILQAPRPADRVLQVHNSFVVTQDEQGLVIVDQHALHERVMFEYLLARVTGVTDRAGGASPGGTRGAALETQRLLVPALVRTTPGQMDRLPDLAPLFARIGIEVEAVGPADLAVYAFPTFLFDRGVEPGPFLEELLARCERDGFVPGGEEALHGLLDMMACKAAVKAGDRLSEPELQGLLKLRESVERSSNCPHGRPTSIRLTIRELEKRFGRT